MRAILVREDGAALAEVSEEILTEGSVLVDVAYSSLNYKDALVVTGKPGVVRTYPLVAGIDLVGQVRESSDERWQPGEWLVLNGAGLSETKHGGYATLALIDPSLAVPVPDGLTPQQVAALGTAGYTAALAVLKIIGSGISPNDGPVLVTGASGGVGSIALLLLNAAGFEVAALSGRVDELGGYLQELGATSLVSRDELSASGKPLQRARYGAVIDSVGGQILANALAQIVPGGVAAACGLAGSSQLPTTVLPFILRGVTLAGIDSVWASLADRADAWRLLARGLRLDLLDSMTSTISLSEVSEAAAGLLAGERHGRTLVTIA